MKPKAAILFTSGTNCDFETSKAFELAGGSSFLVHTNELKNSKTLMNYQAIIIPGGFSFGDHLGSATVWANELAKILGESLSQFIEGKKLVIGICNGFQVLVKLGLLPNTSLTFSLESTLTYNVLGRFESRWVRLLANSQSPCVFTRGIDLVDMPVAHGEGRFIPRDIKVFGQVIKNNQIALQYVDQEGKPTMIYPKNPNGSFASIAGVCDPTGLIFGLMPHPERYLFSYQGLPTKQKNTTGLAIYKNAVKYLK